jgi:hypothetical protein
VDEHGRPSTHAQRADETRHAGWLTAHRALLRDGRLASDRKAALDTAIPGWEHTDTAKDGAWYLQATATAAFIEDRGRMPRADAGDTDERGCGRWLARQVKLADNLAAARRTYLDANIVGWDKPVTGRRQPPRHKVQVGEVRNNASWPWYAGDVGRLPEDTSVPSAAYGIRAAGNVDWFHEDATFEEFGPIISTVVHGRLAGGGRPNSKGAVNVRTWSEWAEGQTVDRLIVQGFQEGIWAATVTLMAARLGISGTDAGQYARGTLTATPELFVKASRLARERTVAAEDLALWEVGLVEGGDRSKRGRLVAGAALSQLDGWWGFRRNPWVISGR